MVVSGLILSSCFLHEAAKSQAQGANVIDRENRKNAAKLSHLGGACWRDMLEAHVGGWLT